MISSNSGYARQWKVPALLFIVMLSLLSSGYAKEEIKLNILAVNPSATEKLNTSISYPLPPEIEPEHIIESQGLSPEYDDVKGVYYLTGPVELAPKEARTISVRLKNVWVLPDEELVTVREQLEKNVTVLKNTKYATTAQLLRDRVVEKISSMEEDQTKDMGVQKRIALYRANMKILDSIKSEVASIASMRELEKEQTAGIRTAKFVINAENPSNETKTMTVRAMLPKDVSATDVLEKQNFLLLYDNSRKRFSLERDDSFGPKESKKYEIILKDIWYIPQAQLDLLKEQTEKLLENFRGSPYENFSVQQNQTIQDAITVIQELQAEVANTDAIEEKMRAFSHNNERLSLAQKKVKELQDLLLEIPLQRKVSEIDKIKHAIKQLTKVMDIVRMGFQPDLSTTWWIILGIIAFVAILATTFYVIWLTKLKESRQISKKTAETAKASAVSAESPGAPGTGKPPAAPKS